MDRPVQHEEEHLRGAFFIEEKGGRLAEMTYSRTPDGRRATIHHTEVKPALQGQGVGKHLVEAAVQWARRENVSLLPRCPYARSVLEREPSFRDVLATDA